MSHILIEMSCRSFDSGGRYPQEAPLGSLMCARRARKLRSRVESPEPLSFL